MTEQLHTAGKPGNFLAYLKNMAKHNQILLEHLNTPQMKNATYVSLTTLNELLEIMTSKYITSQLVSEIKESRFYAIMADEVTSYNNEILALCVRFVDKNSAIREEFFSFTKVHRITGAVLAPDIKNTLETSGLLVQDIRGQGYDGAANMASDTVGVQGRIKADSPKATYVHCNGHCLNLVIAA